MIRSILLIKVKPGTTEDQIEAFRREWLAIPFEFRRNPEFRRGIALADDGMDIALLAEFDDEEAYRAWVADPDHDRVRGEFLDPIREQRERFLSQA